MTIALLLAGVLLGHLYLNEPKAIEYSKLPQSQPQPSIPDSECKPLFRFNSWPDKNFEILGEFKVPKNSYGKNSAQPEFDYQDLINQIKPMVCKNGGNAVLFYYRPNSGWVSRAELLKLKPKIRN